jgi:hypothetical protein
MQTRYQVHRFLDLDSMEILHAPLCQRLLAAVNGSTSYLAFRLHTQ